MTKSIDEKPVLADATQPEVSATAKVQFPDAQVESIPAGFVKAALPPRTLVVRAVLEDVILIATKDLDTGIWETQFATQGDDENVEVSPKFQLTSIQFGAAIALATGFCNPDTTNADIEAELYNVLPKELADTKENWRPFP